MHPNCILGGILPQKSYGAIPTPVKPYDFTIEHASDMSMRRGLILFGTVHDEIILEVHEKMEDDERPL